MKTHANRQRGIALVVVLAFLVLLSVFIVGFFSSSQDELSSAQSFTGEVSAQQLSDSATAVVMGQIREATTRANGQRADGSFGKGAWGSQPGMIRVYGNDGAASSKADAFFKLYSSDKMAVSGMDISSYDPNTEIPTGAGTGWNHLPALWTDMNEPAIQSPARGTNTSAVRYAILDPAVASDSLVEGIELLDLPHQTKFPANLPTNDDSKLPARMPVRWMYVLKDGTLTVPSTSANNGTQAVWKTGQRGPTPTNPIVGRIAFWTDDESCKININTAGGSTNLGITDVDSYPGSFWDTPRAFTYFDRGHIQNVNTGDVADKMGLGLSQPVKGEYQRYPGHPATTSLGVAFRKPTAAKMQDLPYLLTSGQVSLLTPRLQYSLKNSNISSYDAAKVGSDFGTTRVLAAAVSGATYPSNPVPTRVTRLYDSVDELFYAQLDPTSTPAATRTESDIPLMLAGPNASSSTEATVLTPTRLSQMQFFLTAHSRAPELNLFGRPRVTLWPVAEVTSVADESGVPGVTSVWNVSDRLIAFCSTIGPKAAALGNETSVKRFIFQRKTDGKGCYSSNADFNLTRNVVLYNYLTSLTDQAFPGVGGLSFAQKYAASGVSNDRDQILTEMFDYIRTINMRDSSQDTQIDAAKSGAGSRADIQAKDKYKYAPRGIVVPTSTSNIRGQITGFGRFPTISEAALVLYQAGWVGSDGNRYLALPKDSAYVTDPTRTKYVMPAAVQPKAILVRAFIALETFNPMQGFAPIATPNGFSLAAPSHHQDGTTYSIAGLEGFKLENVPLFFTDAPSVPPTNIVHRSSVDLWGGRSFGGSEGFLHTMWMWHADLSSGTAYTSPKNAASELVATPSPYEKGSLWYPFQSSASPALNKGQFDISDHNQLPGIPISIDPKTGLPKPSLVLGGTTLKLIIGFATTATVTNGGTPTVVHNLTLTFPGTTVPTPTDDLWLPGSTGGGGGGLVRDATHPLYAANGYKVVPADPTLGRSLAGRLTWMNSNNRPNADSTNYNGSLIPGADFTNRWHQVLQPGDRVRSVLFGKGDLRVSCLTDDSTVFVPHPDYFNPATLYAQTLRNADASLYFNSSLWTTFGNITHNANGTNIYPPGAAADLPSKNPDGSPFNGVVRRDNQWGDFDTGLGNLPDGPFCGKADEGNLVYRTAITNSAGAFDHWQYLYPYFTWTFGDSFETFFTPNRQVASAVCFGSLLAGKGANWQTLCFSPNPAGANHPGRTDPKDYLWLDLFTMPVVEPYAISEPFSTAGKVNLNYPIVPFGHIKRTTALRAVLDSVRVTGMPVVDVTKYKTATAAGEPSTTNNYRYRVDRQETLNAFDYFFSGYNSDHSTGFFKSAAQVCDFYLYPRKVTAPLVTWAIGESPIKNWWNQQALTGDNVREKPYGDLYPRLTTKSNTFCVHVRAQALRQTAPAPGEVAANHYLVWDEKRDKVIGEYRGSSVIERYLDPDDARFNKTNTVTTKNRNYLDPDLQPLEDAYRFRVVNTKRFSP